MWTSGRPHGTLQDRRDPSWDSIDGLWMQAGCYTSQLNAKRSRNTGDDKISLAQGKAENGTRIKCWPRSTKIDGASGTYRPMGAPGISASLPGLSRRLRDQMAVDKLDGKDVPKTKAPVAGPGCKRGRGSCARPARRKR